MAKKKIVYQLYPIAWEQCSPNALTAMTEHLERIKSLEVDYVWLSPMYPSPRWDGGYDISDYKRLDERFGGYDDLARFISKAHSLGIGVLFDLVLNHTSAEHKWFKEHPEYYIWSTKDREGWHNLFDEGSAWECVAQDTYYLHLFHPKQADLNWYPDNSTLNGSLVKEFQDIIAFWCDIYHIDGFRLDVPQAINKDLAEDSLELSDLLYETGRDTGVINAIFKGREDLFLMMECFDPTNGELIEYYAENTPVDFILDVILKDEVEKSREEFKESLKQLCEHSQYMLDLESHDSPRFASRGNIEPEDMIWEMFNSKAEAICLYQGQELCLRNPTKEELPATKMLDLDAMSAMRAKKGENIADIRKSSRANARVPIPMDEYSRQENAPESYLNLTKLWIRRWKGK
ncbi:hypothetical protein IJG27_04645 [Candidatus Saccharibacteria bacterium]|nr:hypothetical protein [Candidatus Saccharibacteria bacterium]